MAIVAGASVLLGACTNSYDQYFLPLLDPDSVASGGGGTGGSGGTGGTDPGCIPSQTPNPVRDDCGIFVSTSKGDDANDGSQAKPYATIGKALASPKSGPIHGRSDSTAHVVDLS
jgi:hypothetical protein